MEQVDAKVFLSVDVYEEAGYKSAIRGLSFNKNQDIEKMPMVAEKLAGKDFGHNKFLESIIVWLEVTAPRYWWQEADTYRISTKQSASTMHTLIKELTGSNVEALRGMFEDEEVVDFSLLKKRAREGDLVGVKQALPESFLQRRMWCMSYKTLRNIIIQRKNHRMPHWKKLIKGVLSQVEHPELLSV